MKIYFRDLRIISILAAIAIISVSFGLFFYFQSITENQIRASLFRQQELRQHDSTMAIASHIESDLTLLSSELKMLALSPSLQISGGSLPANARTLAQEAFAEINTNTHGSPTALVERLLVLDNNGVALIDIGADSQMQNLEGSSLSSREYFQNVRSTLAPSFSKGFIGIDGEYKIAVSYPILDESGRFLGLVAATASAESFFQHYGNIHDIESQYLSVLDTDSVQLVHPVDLLVGVPFFGQVTQEATGGIQVLNNLVASVLAGVPGQAVYEFRGSERLTTGYPIYLAGEPTYFVFVVTPTSVIYTDVANTLAAQRMETFYLLVITTAIIFVLIVFLASWNNNLRGAVAAKTEQLVKANEQLSIANEHLIENYEQLRATEKMQKEFINVAAHELRTPVQPIIGLSDVLVQQSTDPETRMLLEAIYRNAKRLHRLSSDILDVARIESKSMRLAKEQVDISKIAKQAIDDAKSQMVGNNVEIVLVEPQDNLPVFVDKQRIQQVLTNLLDNAIKFTEQGKITVAAQRQKENGKDIVVVKVMDGGSGIDPEIMPKLFSMFTSRSDKGTGLGLYISKSIIDAHGGKIWAENNQDKSGATFSFSLPVARAAIDEDKWKTDDAN